MKTVFQKVKCLCIAALVVCSVTSCDGGVDSDEAKAFIGDFFTAVAAEDYERAETYFHPERPADLETFLTGVEESENVDFQAGITVEKYTGFSSSYYDGTVDGSRLELTMMTTVGESDVEFTVEIVQNEKGYGIYNLDIDA